MAYFKELKDEELEKVSGGKNEPLSNKSTIDEVEVNMNVFAFDSVNLVFRWGKVIEKQSKYIIVSFGSGNAFVDGQLKNLTPCIVRIEEFWLSPNLF